MMELPHLAVNQHAWLYANTFTMFGVAGLIVYRSHSVRHTDEVYQPVLDLLNKTVPRLVVQQTVEDEEMMFGRAELEVYRFGGTEGDTPLFLKKILAGLEPALGKGTA